MFTTIIQQTIQKECEQESSEEIELKKKKRIHHQQAINKDFFNLVRVMDLRKLRYIHTSMLFMPTFINSLNFIYPFRLDKCPTLNLTSIIS